MTLDDARRLHALGLNVIALQPRSKEPDCKWKQYQEHRTTTDDLSHWFTTDRNAGIVLGATSNDVVVVESDTPEAEAWCAANLPRTPMATQSARGFHRYYRRPAIDQIPAFIYTPSGLEIEVKREGQYVVAPGSIHPLSLIHISEPTRPY